MKFDALVLFIIGPMVKIKLWKKCEILSSDSGTEVITSYICEIIVLTIVYNNISCIIFCRLVIRYVGNYTNMLSHYVGQLLNLGNLSQI